MIELTIRELLSSEQALNKLKVQAEDDGFDFSLSYKILKLIENLYPEFSKAFKQIDIILDKFGIKNEKGIISIPQKNQISFSKNWETFLNNKLEVLNVFKFNKNELANAKSFTLQDVADLEVFIENNDPEK